MIFGNFLKSIRLDLLRLMEEKYKVVLKMVYIGKDFE